MTQRALVLALVGLVLATPAWACINEVEQARSHVLEYVAAGSGLGGLGSLVAFGVAFLLSSTWGQLLTGLAVAGTGMVFGFSVVGICLFG